MNWRKGMTFALLALVLFCFIIGSLPILREAHTPASKEKLEIHVIDVGQGDSILLRSAEHSMLIDGGTPGNSARIYTYLTKLGITHLDYIIATHPHDDHAGGLAGALNIATADTALSSVSEADGRAFQNFLKYLKKQNVTLTVPSPGDTYEFGDASFTVLGPIRESTIVNDTSLVILLRFGSFQALFTGDAEAGEERDILDAGTVPGCDFLKVGHHGSANANSEEWIQAVHPRLAVISCGKNNDYGHPAAQTLDRLQAVGAEILRTDLLGDIVVSIHQDGSYEVQNKHGTEIAPGDTTYVINLRTGKFHDPNCPSVREITPGNRQETSFDREALLSNGYEPCGKCKP